MKSIDDLAAILPRRRDDEPPELRAQIVKELRDHLECAYQRELLRTGDAARAAQRVEEQFGDARQLARKLWFEAMQEKIMSQRILVGLSAALAVACLAIGGFALRIAQQTAEASAAATKALADQGQETNQALLRALDRLVPKPEPAMPAEPEKIEETGEIRLKLVKGLPGGPPAADCKIVVIPARTENYDRSDFVGVSNAQGEFVAENVVTGERHVNVSTPWGESAQIVVEVVAGKANEMQEIICPDAALSELEVALDVQWPEDLRGAHLGLLVFCSDTRRIGGVDWTVVMTGDEGASCIVTTGGMMLRSYFNCGPSVSPNEPMPIAFQDPHAFPRTTIRHKGTDFHLQVLGVVILGDGHAEETHRLVQIVRDSTDDVDPAEFSAQLTPGQADQHVSIPILPELAANVRRALGRPFDPTANATGTPQRVSPDGKPDVAEIDKQIEELTNRIRNDPKSESLYGLRYQMWCIKGDLAKAATDISECIRLDPENYHYYSMRSRLWHDIQEFDKEFDDLGAYIKMEPDAKWTRWALGRQAETWAKRGKFQKAIEEYTKLIQSKPDDADMYMARGRLSQKAHSPANALLDYIEALARGPESSDTHSNLAWFFATAADPKYRNGKRSLKLATEACRLSGWRDWKALNALAAAHAETGDFALAVAWQAKALEMNRNVFMFYNVTDAENKAAETRLEEYKAGRPWRDPE